MGGEISSPPHKINKKGDVMLFDKPRQIVLFQDETIIDAMSDLASLTTHLINTDDGDYGKTLIHIMIRDTLLHLITRLQDSLPAPDTD